MEPSLMSSQGVFVTWCLGMWSPLHCPLRRRWRRSSSYYKYKQQSNLV